jgi:hypothetical protein
MSQAERACNTTAVMAQQRGPAMGDSLKTAHSVSLKVLRYVLPKEIQLDDGWSWQS